MKTIEDLTMRSSFEFITNFFSDVFETIKYIYDFSTNKKISRLRVFFVWSLVALIPSFFIYFTINTWQVHIPGVEAASANNSSIISMILSTSILPVLFFLTNGLRGYHNVFNYLLEAIFSRFELVPAEELLELYGTDATEMIKKVNLGKHVSGFLMLELMIISWATISYFLFGGNMSGLGLFGYIGDDLLMGAIVFVLEGIYCIVDGIVEASHVYRLKPLFAAGDDAKTDKWIEVTEGAHMLHQENTTVE